MTDDTQHQARWRRFEAYLHRGRLCRGGKVEFRWSDGDRLHFSSDGNWFEVNTDKGSVSPAAEPPSQDVPARETWMRGGFIAAMPAPEMLSPDGRWLASVRDKNIVLRSTRDGRIRALTSDGTADQSWDIEADRYRILPGLEPGTASTSPWRPDGRALFACRRDISGVFRIPVIHWLNDFEEVDFSPFEKAGARVDRYHPYVIDIRKGPIALDVGEVEDRYLHLLGWRPDGAEVFIVLYSRDMREARIVAADGRSGEMREVMTEQGETFVRIQHDTLMSSSHGFAFLPDSSGFLWLSTRDGWNHIFSYAADGALLRQLTTGEWPVHDIEAVSGGFVYFTASPDQARPYDIHVCRVSVEGGEVEQLTTEAGMHRPEFAPGATMFLDTHSSVDRPPATDLFHSDGRKVARLAHSDIGGLEDAGYVAPEEFTVRAADGVTQLWGVLYKPADFDPARQYPVLEHIYGGPQVVATARHFSAFEQPARNLAWALAQIGFIVVSLDARGTPGRSKAFQDVVYGNWGDHVIADHATAVRQLCERHVWMDPDRVGIIGHSWGGYFSSAALIEAPDVYKVAVSSSPGYIPWESILYEPYLGLPSTNAAGYDRADLTQRAAGLKGKLLLVAGTSEYGPISDSMKMSRALIDTGIQHEFAVLPGEHHSYVGSAERYFTCKAARFLQRHLMGPGNG